MYNVSVTIDSKIISYQSADCLSQLRKSSILVGGCFDILHYGHLLFLKKAKRFADQVIVALESDEYILINKKRKQVHTQLQRAKILSELLCVDYVVLLPMMKNDKDYFNLVSKIKPTYIGITKGDPQKINKKKQTNFIGAKLIDIISVVPNFSSREIIKRFS